MLMHRVHEQVPKKPVVSWSEHSNLYKDNAAGTPELRVHHYKDPRNFFFEHDDIGTATLQDVLVQAHCCHQPLHRHSSKALVANLGFWLMSSLF